MLCSVYVFEVIRVIYECNDEEEEEEDEDW